MPERLGDEVVIHQLIVDSPKQQLAERRVVEMRVNIVHTRLANRLADYGGNGLPLGVRKYAAH